MTDPMGPGKLVRHMQNPSYTYDEYLIFIGLGPSISSVICNNPSYSGPSYPSSPVDLNVFYRCEKRKANKCFFAKISIIRYEYFINAHHKYLPVLLSQTVKIMHSMFLKYCTLDVFDTTTSHFKSISL